MLCSPKKISISTLKNWEKNSESAMAKMTAENEKESKEILLEFDKGYPGELKGENINVILEQARQKRNEK